MERRLAAVLAVDVVAYSRLVGVDEVGTLSAVKAHHQDVLKPAARRHAGRIVKLTGDGALMEFPSAVEAVAFAVEVQREMRERNQKVPEDRRIVYRIGINVGDIILEDDDIFGDGVNLAVRLEGLAEPGGICIAGNVYNQVKGKLPFSFVFLGNKRVKNIAEPVPAFQVQLAQAGEPLAVRDAPASRRRLNRGIAAVLALALAAGGAVFWQAWTSRQERPAPANANVHVTDKPSIAVLPFANLSDDRAQDYFSDGMTDDIITDLSKVSGLFVVARNSTFAYKGTSVRIQTAAEELGVRYVLEGSVRRAGNQVRINAQLIDAKTGGHLWADRYDGALDDVFRLQDEITRKIVSVLAVQLTSREQEQLALRKTERPEAYDAFLKGWEAYLRQTPNSFREAIAQFENAVKLDPDHTRAYAALAATYWQIHKRVWNDRVGLRSMTEALFLAEANLEKARRQPTALMHQIAAGMLVQQGSHSEAIAEAAAAISVDPNDADGYVALAGCLSLAGNADKALDIMRQAMRLNPHYPPFYLYELGLAHFGTGDFQNAATALEKATAANPEDRWSSRLLLATYGQLERKADAERMFAIVSRNRLGSDPLTVSAVTFWYPFKEAVDRNRLAAGLRMANVPE